ncbi:MAG: peptidoglycan DD-metalloendopeptidase family protein [Deltaproteobacteria bacterium]|nr:peptidoglycan DD-metalloendopeptidase family protein [Deltaproteobacteria bacterium]
MEKLARHALGLGLCLIFMPRWVDAASASKDLEGIRRKIEAETRGLSQVQKREGSVLRSLGQVQNDLEKKNKALKRATDKLNSIAREMAGKEAEAEKIVASIGQRREILKQRAVALYRWHRGASPLITILGGDMSLSAFLQRKRYLEVTVAFDRDLVNRLTEEVRRQEALRDELAQKKEELAGQRETLREAKESVRRSAEEKKQILASLRREKETRLRALKELEQAALRLQKMMDEMSRRGVAKPQETPAGAGLDGMRGKLEWPVKGEVTSAFGRSRHPEFAVEVFRKGIEIEAPLGQEIRVVEKGRVAFADRFSGYGKMVIVDHGQRFFTIYAHLSDILKIKGDEIRRGEVLGLAGDSDSLAGVKLYFEMRKDGRSIDPVPWFQK